VHFGSENKERHIALFTFHSQGSRDYSSIKGHLIGLKQECQEFDQELESTSTTIILITPQSFRSRVLVRKLEVESHGNSDDSDDLRTKEQSNTIECSSQGSSLSDESVVPSKL
jgi:hypothetical protein